MNQSKGISLRTKIIGMVVGLLLLLGAGSLFSMKQMETAYKKDIFDSFESTATSLSEKLSAQFFERYGDVKTFASSGEIQSLNPKQAEETLQRFSEAYGIYDLILLVDAQGRYVASSSTDSKGNKLRIKELSEITYGEAPWFKAIMKEQFTEDKERGFTGTFFEEPSYDPVLKVAMGKAQLTTSFSTTVKDKSGQIVGVLTSRSIKWLEDSLSYTYKALEKEGNTSVQLSVLNKDGVVIADIFPSKNGGKTTLTEDTEKFLFKKNMKEDHQPVGAMFFNKESGSILSNDQGKIETDVVGFATLSNQDWNRSVKWVAMVHDTEEEVLASAHAALRNFYLIFGMVTFIAFAVAVFFGIAISKTITGLTETLAKNSNEVSEASTKIATSSTELSEAATEQAAALQQTVAAVDEISAMVDKNAESANRSKEASAHSREAAVRGRQIVDDMIQAIGEISQSNDQVSNQMDTSNQQLTEITKLINDIGSKTKVINEIVFQTKLLSFNASVEAARAGEYGKGFAVVAEEVGNLAQMSGNAAKEITTLLEESVRKVETIVSESKSKVERLMQQSQNKVQVGSDTAKSCNEALEEILTNVSSVDTLVSEIAVASQEQATGIREISKAVGQMEQVTQQNSTVAEQSSVAAEQLSTQAAELRGIVGDLFTMVKGGGANGDLVVASSETHQKPKLKSSSNVVKLKARKKVSPQHDYKKASGGDFAPSANNPGFED